MPLLIFSLRLKQLMDAEKLSVRKLSLQTKVDRSSITTYVQGSSVPRVDALARIADYFEINSDFLLGIDEESTYAYKTSCDYNEIQNVFVTRLKELMKEKQLSQNKLAEKIKMQQASISKWLRGQTTPDIFALIDLAKVFNCKVDYLIGRERI